MRPAERVANVLDRPSPAETDHAVDSLDDPKHAIEDAEPLS